VWFVGPFIKFSDYRPLGGFWTRFWIVSFVVITVSAYYGYKFWKKRKEAKALEAALLENAEDDHDGEVLSERMGEALEVLKKSSAKTDYLYDLPWYVIIGPPGAGKTTALVNSGLKFPISGPDGAASVAGAGGTRYCDWWFTEDAVLIDTAGRYTSQDSDAESDGKSWLSFLSLLKRYRKNQPINGVIVAISIEDILKQDQEELDRHIESIQNRLMEINKELKVEFPVYILFTKVDLISGFMEYFGNFSESRRRQVWGTTFQTTDRNKNMVGEVAKEFDALTCRLTEELPDRLHEEPDGLSRIAIYGFPAQFSLLKDKVEAFLTGVFESTRYRATANLRGFYFSSGTREGTPFDTVLGAMQQSFGVEESPLVMSSQGRSFFLHDLLKKVIFAESGWVSLDMKAVRRSQIFRYGALSAICAATLGIISLWSFSYYNNSKLIEASKKSISEYRVIAVDELEVTEISDSDIMPIISILDNLRYMPTGYENRNVDIPISETFGLNQRKRLISSSQTSYHKALERMFRTRIILRLESQLEELVRNNETLAIYETLKVYLMLGGKAPNNDRDLIITWMRNDWSQNLYPGPQTAPARKQMEAHLVAMLDLGAHQRRINFELNGPLVENAQLALSRMNIADQAYALISSSSISADIEDFRVANRAGAQSELIFETADGTEFTDLRIKGLYTYRGFHEFFLDQLAAVGEKLVSEQWVLGKAGERTEIEQQLDSLGPQLLDRYSADFTRIWYSTFENMRFKPLSADKPNYNALSIVSSPTSPLKALFEAVAEETMLTAEQGGAGGNIISGLTGGAGGQDSVSGDVASAVINRFRQRMGGLSRIGLDIAIKKTQNRAGGGSGGGGSSKQSIPGANIEGQFKGFHRLVTGDTGRRPIDAIVGNLNKIYQGLSYAAANPTQSTRANAAVQAQLNSLRVVVSRLPKPLTKMVNGAINDFEGDTANNSIAQLNQILTGTVGQTCRRIVENRYPFSPGSSRNVPMTSFANLFAPNGVIDSFFNKNFSHLVDTSDKIWKWNEETRLGQELSKAALRDFQRAAEIRDAFFPDGGSEPTIDITINQYAIHPEVSDVLLEINDQVLLTKQVSNTPLRFKWPGNAASGIFKITLTPPLSNGQVSEFIEHGPWALMRAIRKGNSTRDGDNIRVQFNIAGRYVTYVIRVDSVANPFYLGALSEFKCPTGL